jgi:hypothetical protein
MKYAALVMEVVMPKLYFLKKGLWFVLLPVVLCLMWGTAFAGEKAGKKSPQNEISGPTATVEANAPQQLSDEQMALLKKGPPEFFGEPGYYIKTRGKTAGTIKYFKNGHPENNSEWEYYGQ